MAMRAQAVSRRILVGAPLALAAAWLAGCASPPLEPSPPPAPVPPAGPVLTQKAARWVAADWDALPGWRTDTVTQAWPALWRSCAKPAPAWVRACASVRTLGPQLGEAQARQWMQQALRPYRVEGQDGQVSGLMTGYFEPMLRASRTRQAPYVVPLYRPPADLSQRRPWWTRAEMETEPAARAALAGREIAWVADPLDAVFLQVQGSGRLQFVDGQGRSTGPQVRVVNAGTNEQPFRPLSAWLIQQGAFTAAQANADAIRSWAAANPARMTELVQSNPRVAFFQERPLDDPSLGPPGSQGVPLTPGRSIAVDRDAIPLGTPVWVDTTEPQKWQPQMPPPRPMQRLMVAQDTGGAIRGAVRADFFWGWADDAGAQAGRMKQPLRMWVLWPRE